MDPFVRPVVRYRPPCELVCYSATALKLDFRRALSRLPDRLLQADDQLGGMRAPIDGNDVGAHMRRRHFFRFVRNDCRN
jgi:hypothetical protein